MFIDRLLEISCNFPKEHIKTAGFPKPLTELLKEAICIDITNVVTFIDTKMKNNKTDSATFEAKDCPNVKSPFDIIFFESNPLGVFIEVAKNNNEIIKKMGVLLCKENRIETFGGDIYQTWMFTEHYNSDVEVSNPLSFQCSEMGQLYKWGNTNFGYNNDKAVFLGLLPVLMTISFLHCKNVTIQSTEPPVKLQKARERRGKLPLFTFKTLEIKPMVKILKEEGESETKGLKYALHICRGHFKDFSQGPGLGRGHAHGLYWWDSQVRGSKEVGAVIKDYKVSPDDKSLKR